MRFNDLLNEKYKDSAYMHGTLVELFVNPSKKELRDIIKVDKYNTMRIGMSDKRKPVLYAWVGNTYHFEIEQQFNIKFDFGFVYTPGNPVFPFTWDNVTGRDWKKMKNKEAMIKEIKKKFPKAKVIRGNVYDIPLESTK